MDLHWNPRGLQLGHWTQGPPHSHSHLLAEVAILQVLQGILHT